MFSWKGQCLDECSLISWSFCVEMKSLCRVEKSVLSWRNWVELNGRVYLKILYWVEESALGWMVWVVWIKCYGFSWKFMYWAKDSTFLQSFFFFQYYIRPFFEKLRIPRRPEASAFLGPNLLWSRLTGSKTIVIRNHQKII